MKNLWNTEPALILAVVQMAIALLISFGVTVTVEQAAAIMGFSAAVLGLILRRKVTPA